MISKSLPFLKLILGAALWAFSMAGTFAQETLVPPENLHVAITDTSQQNVLITWDFNNSDDVDFQGFNLYRNDNKINAGPLENSSYNDIQLDTGTYTYEAEAVYTSGTSAKSNRGLVTIREGYYFDLGSFDPSAPTWSIYINSGLLGQQWLSPGDELAIFDVGAPNTLLTGRIKLTEEPYEENDLIELVAFSQFAETNGYTPGNEYLFKLYDASNDTLYQEYVIDFDESGDNYAGEVFPEGDDPASLVDIIFSLGFHYPENLQISNENHDITLSWDMVQPNNLIGFDIYRNDDKINTSPVSGTTYTDEEVLSGTYEYYVIAAYDEGYSLPSETKEFTLGTVFYEPPEPDNLSDSSTLVIHESSVMDSSLLAFDEIGVYKKSGNDTLCLGATSLTDTLEGSASDTIVVGSDDPSTDSIEGFSEGDTLYYHLYDYSETIEYTDAIVDLEEGYDGTSSYTFIPDSENHVSLTWVPFAPSSLSTEVNGYDITLSWQENPGNPPGLNVLGYDIYRDGENINDSLVEDTTYTDINLLVDVYDYYVQAIYEEDSSRLSDTITAEVPTQYFTPESENASAGTMSFYVTQAQIDGEDLGTYDEIGIFSYSEDEGKICVGAGSLHNSLSQDEPLNITAYEDDPGTPEKDGYEEGDNIRYEFWESGANDTVYFNINHTFPYDSAQGYNYNQYSSGDTCYVNLSFTTPEPVEFHYNSQDYCKETTRHVYVTVEDFQEIDSLHLVMLMDTDHYNYQSIEAEQDFLDNIDTLYNDDNGTLTVDWASESDNSYSVASGDTLLDITIFTTAQGNTSMEWSEDSYSLGMQFQEDEFYPEDMYIEKTPEAPVTIYGDDTVCNTVNYSEYSIDPIPNATNYSWEIYSDDGDPGTLEDPYDTICQVNWNDEFDGTADLSVEGENDCGVGESATKTIIISDEVSVDVNIVVINSTTCEGEEIVIQAIGSNLGSNPTYNWYINDEEIYENSNTLTYANFSDSDLVYCVAESSQPCAINNPDTSNTVEIQLDPLPAEPTTIVGDTLMCNTVGSSEYTTPGSEFSDSYDWNLTPDEAGETNCLNTNPCQTITIEWNTEWTGIAKLWVRGVNDCGPGDYMTPPLNIHRDYCTSTSQTTQAQWHFYPNPVENRLTIESISGDKLQWQLLRTSGQILKSGRLTDKKTSIDVEALSPGLYFLKVQTPKGVVVNKVIKK